MIILGFYKYVEIDDPENLKENLNDFCESRDFKGNFLLAKEGINASVSASEEHINELKDYLLSIPLLEGLFFKEEVTGSGHPFKKLKIKVKKEIVGFKRKIDLNQVGNHITSEELLDIYDNDGNLKDNVILLDVRNDYEFKVGRFKGAQQLGLNHFREFTAKSINLLKQKEKKIIMYCTGGVRCEKASAYLKQIGIKDVSQLNQGIINFGKDFPDSVWEGKCFVFDRRMVSPINQTKRPISECLICNEKCDFQRNCRNVNCNKFYVSCLDCEKTLSKCCSNKCAEIYKKSKNTTILNLPISK
jgi:UPF0176 protein